MILNNRLGQSFENLQTIKRDEEGWGRERENRGGREIASEIFFLMKFMVTT